MNYRELPDKLREALDAATSHKRTVPPEYLSWMQNLAEEDYPSLLKVLGWKFVSAELQDEAYINRGMKWLHVVATDAKKKPHEIRFDAGQLWFIKTERGTWELLEDPRKPKRRVIRRG